ncbi:asparagine synthase-related protein [Mucilaginibacter sp.]|uniref:asparagine synthase-related protein n=1 Tax=Mucilaginibacter sp. TaxID=1882438 RepID=UPI00284CA844|nr:asparagine synthase-related protein [Mucilaginibacter sp.]MDR3697525.1 asparagine synthase-related protein [Mucilaginibacter sp.]
MSSIFGKLNFNQNPLGDADLTSMENALNHWDAEDKNVWENDYVALGHLMLYNTPESLYEKLPLYNNDRRLTITADARIDNRDELFNKLGLLKQETKFIPDSTLIMKAYEKYGEDCVKHLIGDFAFAIWDANEQKLFCARDHIGVKPFFYYKDEYFFAFATEPSGLLAINGLNKEISEDYFLKLVAHLTPQKKETAYRYIFRLDVAHSLTVTGAAIQLRRYWELDAKREIVYKDKQQYIEKFRELFTEAIRCRLRSNYLVGTELSGGLDSSGITSIASRLLHAENKKIAAFVVVAGPKELYEDENYREEMYADEVIKFAAIDYVNKRLSVQSDADFLQLMDERLSVYGYPCFAAASWNRDLYKTASPLHVRTLLSGHGGDQLVTDYNNNYILDYINDKQYKNYFKLAIKQWGARQAIVNFFKNKIKQPYPAIVNKLTLTKITNQLNNADINFLNPEFFPKLIKHVSFDGFPATFKEVQKQRVGDDFVGNRMEYETLNGLKYKISPAFPMQDIRVMEFVLAVPTDEKMQPGKDRLLYRRAMQGLMPEMIVHREKKNISTAVPIGPVKWLNRQDDVKKWILELKKQERLTPFINYDKLMPGYTWQRDGDIAFGSLLAFKRRQLELIIRWFETRNHFITHIESPE